MIQSCFGSRLFVSVVLLSMVMLHLLLRQNDGADLTGAGMEALSTNKIPDSMVELIKKSDLIVRGRVATTHSAWNADHTLIETDNLIDVHYALFGDAPQQLRLHTLGGVLADEDLGMAASDAMTLAPQEELLLFLHKQGNQYQMVGDQTDQSRINNGIAALNHGAPQSVRDLVSSIASELMRQGLHTRLPTDWQSREPQTVPRSGSSVQNFVYKGYKWPDQSPVVKYKVNINTAQAGGTNGSVEDFRQAIVAAANTWNQVPNIDFKFQYDGETAATTVGAKSPGFNGVNEIIFMHQGITNTAGLGIYFFRRSDNRIIEGDIWLNDDYKWDATGSPADDELDMQSGALHEFGHLLNLGHDPDASSIMFSSLDPGTLKRTLSSLDQAGIQFIYPCNNPACRTVEPTATSTPTPSSTAIATPELRPSPTPTLAIGSRSKAYLPLVEK